MGVCGKDEGTAELQDKLTGALIGLARATEGNEGKIRESVHQLILEGLFATLTNVNFDGEHFYRMLDWVEVEKQHMVSHCYECAMSCRRNNAYDMDQLGTSLTRTSAA